MIKIALILMLFPLYLWSAQYALLVGSSNGGDGVAQLRYVKSDLIAMKQVLVDHCRYAPDRIAILKDGTPEELALQFQSLKRKLTADDQLFFYYTGHADQKSFRMGKRRFDLTLLKGHLDQLSSALQVVVLDACQSGSFSRLKGGSMEEPLLLSSEPTGTGRVVLFSSSESEYSQESDYLKHSVFSFYFTNGLRGMADISGDRKVTLDEAYRYAYSQTVAATVHSSGGVQHPGFLFDYRGKGEIILSDQSQRNSAVILDRAIVGQVVIIDPARQIVADFTADGSREIRIALNPGKYTVYRNHNGKSAKKSVSVAQKPTYVPHTSFQSVRSIPILKKGGESPTLVAIHAGGGAHIFQQEPLTDFLREKIAVPESYSLESALNLPALRVGGGFSTFFPRGPLVSLTFAYARSHGDISDEGSVSGPIGDSYPLTITQLEGLTYRELHLMGGYRFRLSPRMGLSLLGGTAVSHTRFASEGTVHDAFLNQTETFSVEKTQSALRASTGVSGDYLLSPSFAIFTNLIAEQELLTFTGSSTSLDPLNLLVSLGFTFYLNGE